MNLELFAARLRQVIPWTAQLAAGFDLERGDYGVVFRQTNPLIDGQPLYRLEPAGDWYDGTRASWNGDVYNLDWYREALRAALAQRAVLLTVPTISVTGSALRQQGRILGFETQLTTHDGAAIADSQGLVDESDVPPLDTWVYLSQQVPGRPNPVLFCWIPKPFEPVMQQAIDVEMMGSYYWLDQADAGLHRRIKALL